MNKFIKDMRYIWCGSIVYSIRSIIFGNRSLTPSFN